MPARILKGTVFSGINKAGFFVNLLVKNYGKLQKGMQFFPGTLNIKLSDPFIMPSNAIKVEAESYGGTHPLYLLPVRINDAIAGYIVRSDATMYNDHVVEVLAEVPLRKELTLRDGDSIEISWNN